MTETAPEVEIRESAYANDPSHDIVCHDMGQDAADIPFNIFLGDDDESHNYRLGSTED